MAAFASGNYMVQQYDILHAGSVSGTFALPGAANLPANFIASLSYTATDVFVGPDRDHGPNRSPPASKHSISRMSPMRSTPTSTMAARCRRIF